MKVLFVCTGNTCRSPLAEVYLKKRRPDWDVLSAGVAAVAGAKASKNARKVAAEEGLNLSEHSARRVQELELGKFDRIFAMTPGHLGRLPRESEGALLSSLAGKNEPVEDPYGGDLALYRRVFDQIKELLDLLIAQDKEVVDVWPDATKSKQ